MTKNKAREKNLENSKDFKIIDLLVRTNANTVSNYNEIDSIRIGLKTRLKCFFFKIKHPYIESSLIIEFYASKIIFTKKLKLLKIEPKNSQVFIREGIAQVTRSLMQCARELAIPTVTYYQRIILGNITFVPRETSKVIVITKKGLPDNFITYDAEIISLNDNPYISWRHLSAERPNQNIYGLLVGDENSRYLQQKKIDQKILERISKQHKPKCIIRPHPQEMSKPHRVEYYESLARIYNFVEIDTSSSAEDFIENVDIVITYVNSTLVDEALLCKRPVIVVKKESETVNQKTIDIASDFCCVVDSEDSFRLALNLFSSMSISQLDSIWNKVLDSLDFKENSIVDIDNLLMA
jgi:transcription antitermination factor NusG